VNCQVNGVSHDASKEVIIARLAEKKILQLHPSLATSLPNMQEGEAARKSMLNDKVRLINVIFSDELSDLAISSEDSSTCAELLA
jgi:hypothetical protein